MDSNRLVRNAENNKHHWISAHLFYAEPWERLLINAVKPLVESLKLNGLITQFFFIRFWTRGPHIRLRLCVTKSNAKHVRMLVDSYFADYFSNFPSSRNEPEPSSQGKSLLWYPNDSVRFIQYRPEYIRYGGSKGMKIAQKHFEVSSEAVLAVLAESDTWSYQRALGISLQMQLALIYGLKLSPDKILRIYSLFLHSRIHHLVSLKKKKKTAWFNNAHDILLIYERKYKQIEQTLVPSLHSLWDSMQKKILFSERWFNDFCEGVLVTGNQLSYAVEWQELTLSSMLERSTIPVQNRYEQLFCSIVGSYIHMTNNRLGINTHDEAFLIFLNKKVFEHIYSTTLISESAK